MASPIPGDSRNRKTFAFKEANYTDEHNRNWTQTVEQANDNTGRIVALEVQGTTQGGAIDSVNNTVANLTTTVNAKLSQELYSTALANQSMAVASSQSATGATTINVSATRVGLAAGDQLYALNLDTGATISITVAAVAASGASVLTVSPLSATVPAGSPIMVRADYALERAAAVDQTVNNLAAETVSYVGAPSDSDGTTFDGLSKQLRVTVNGADYWIYAKPA